MERLTPSFFIIGERKCGTSALYRYILEHPQVLPCRVKEPQFFSKPAWYRLLFFSRYRSLFPVAGERSSRITWYDLDEGGKIAPVELTFHADPHRRVVTGEASANTFAQVPPHRLYAAYPDARLIVCLRDPVERAYSHYQMLRRFAAEGRWMPVLFTEFLPDFELDWERMLKGRPSYFAVQSLYTSRLKAWSEVFTGNQIAIVRTEDLANPAQVNVVLDELCAHLNIDQYDFGSLVSDRFNVSPGNSRLTHEIREKIFSFYTSDLKALEAFTGRNFNWHP